jgi:hypothetical protein
MHSPSPMLFRRNDKRADAPRHLGHRPDAGHPDVPGSPDAGLALVSGFLLWPQIA